MSNSGKGRRGRPRGGRRSSPDIPAGNGRTPEPEWQDGQDGQEDHGGVERNWRRNLRRREPSTPDNSWLATQPEFQRYWGEHGEAEPAPPEYPQEEPHVDPQVAPQSAPRPRQRPRRKPADLSTLMARYTARAEEQENFALPPSARQRQPSPAAPPTRDTTPQHRPQGQAPAPARKKAPDPKFVASPLPAEMPEVEPGRPAQTGSARVSQKVAPAPASGGASGTIIVSDGQVRVIEADGEASEARAPDAGEPAHPTDGMTGPAARTDEPAPEMQPEYDAHGVSDIEARSLPQEDADTSHLQMPLDAAEIEWQDPETGAEYGSGEGDYLPPPPHEPQADPLEPGLDTRKWPSEPGGGPTHAPVRFDGPLPYQDASRDPQGPSLADWDAANERLEFEPAWHAREGGMGFGGKFLVLLLFLGVAGGGYAVWSGKTDQLVEFASSFIAAPGSTPNPNLGDEPVVSQAPEAPAGNLAPISAATPPAAPAPGQPQPSTIPLGAVAQGPVAPAPAVVAAPGERVEPDPNMITRQIEGPAAQTTTLWWKPKTVTLFSALTPAELAGQPEPPSARGESVMAPSGPLPGAEGEGAGAASSSADAGEVSRIDELIQSFAIKKAEDSIAPLLASAPGEPAYLMLSGRTALAKSSNLQALATFDKVLAADPGNADAKTARGRALANLGRATEAQAIAAEVLAQNANHLGALWLSVQAQSAMGALDAAIEICGRLEGAGALAGSAEWCRGVANKRARRPLQAETIFISALQSGSRDFVAARQLYFRFKGYFNGAVDGFSSDALLAAATRCTAVRDCNTAGI